MTEDPVYPYAPRVVQFVVIIYFSYILAILIFHLSPAYPSVIIR